MEVETKRLGNDIELAPNFFQKSFDIFGKPHTFTFVILMVCLRQFEGEESFGSNPISIP